MLYHFKQSFEQDVAFYNKPSIPYAVRPAVLPPSPIVRYVCQCNARLGREGRAGMSVDSNSAYEFLATESKLRVTYEIYTGNKDPAAS